MNLSSKSYFRCSKLIRVNYLLANQSKLLATTNRITIIQIEQSILTLLQACGNCTYYQISHKEHGKLSGKHNNEAVVL